MSRDCTGGLSWGSSDFFFVRVCKVVSVRRGEHFPRQKKDLTCTQAITSGGF